MPRALISVSDKHRAVELARGLSELGWEVISTGGTGKLLTANGVKVTPIEQVTEFPEILDGRVKTLNPRIFAGILHLRANKEHTDKMAELSLEAIDLVACNVYPFEEVACQGGVDECELLENIDIGGPSLIRAGAKNYRDVIILVDPADYEEALKQLKEKGDVDLETRRTFALKALARTASYDSFIYNELHRFFYDDRFPEELFLSYRKQRGLRYGENPHQQASLYSRIRHGGFTDWIEPLWGKELSYNNIVDVEASLSLLSEFDEPTCVIVKHTNPCGVASNEDLLTAYERALECDPVSAFGGIVALNCPVDETLAKKINEMFYEIVVAPEFGEAAMDVLKEKKQRRLLRWKKWEDRDDHLKVIGGDLLVQSADLEVIDMDRLEVKAGGPLSEEDLKEILFAYRVVKHVKSNAIVLTKDRATIGVGAGQMNRLQSARFALQSAGEKARGAVMSSDAFFPFRDSIDEAAKYGVRIAVEPGGSVRDEEVIRACEEHNITLVFTNLRHFRH
jgi:phosphoribosylaminoimidazolecarboxamide formyltransferase/IMP cyclohydrolase